MTPKQIHEAIKDNLLLYSLTHGRAGQSSDPLLIAINGRAVELSHKQDGDGNAWHAHAVVGGKAGPATGWLGTISQRGEEISCHRDRAEYLLKSADRFTGAEAQSGSYEMQMVIFGVAPDDPKADGPIGLANEEGNPLIFKSRLDAVRSWREEVAKMANGTWGQEGEVYFAIVPVDENHHRDKSRMKEFIELPGARLRNENGAGFLRHVLEGGSREEFLAKRDAAEPQRPEKKAEGRPRRHER